MYTIGIYGYANGDLHDNAQLMDALAEWAVTWTRGSFVIAGDFNCELSQHYSMLQARDAGHVTDVLHAQSGYHQPRPSTTQAGASIDYILLSAEWVQRAREVTLGPDGEFPDPQDHWRHARAAD